MRGQVAATCKHFDCYDMENWGGVERYWFNAIVTPQDLVETFNPSFEVRYPPNLVILEIYFLNFTFPSNIVPSRNAVGHFLEDVRSRCACGVGDVLLQCR